MKDKDLSNGYNVSLDPAVEALYNQVTKPKDLNTLFDRYPTQQPKCKFGEDGICCDVCGMGPCKITANSPRGVCGAKADTIVSRNFLRHIACGAAAYIHHAKEAARILELSAKGKAPYSIKGAEKLKEIALKMGLSPKDSIESLAQEVVEYYYQDIHCSSDSPSRLVELFGPKKRVERWRQLGILPGGAESELLDALTRTMSHINTDPTDLIKDAMRLSISAMYSGLMMAVTFQDIVLGIPEVKPIQTNLGILDPKSVNIVVHGHQALLALKIAEAQKDTDLLNKAKEAGASGIKVYGSTDVGQELVSRKDVPLAGQLGSWMKQEFLIATGVIDAIVLDFNCSIPGLKVMADNFHTRVISISSVVSMDGIEKVEFSPERADEAARTIAEMAIEAYKKRDPDKVNIPQAISSSIVGFSKEAILGLGENLNILLDALNSGKVSGIAAVAGCTNPYTGRQDSTAVTIAEELIARNILVVTAGCCNSEIQHTDLIMPAGAKYAGDGLKEVCNRLKIPPVLSFGSCTEIYRIVDLVTTLADKLSVDVPDLLVAVSVPEWMDEKSLTDALFCVTFGLVTHISPKLPISGSRKISSFLSHVESKRKYKQKKATVLDILGGEFICDSNPVNAATLLEYHMDRKRQRLAQNLSYCKEDSFLNAMEDKK